MSLFDRIQKQLLGQGKNVTSLEWLVPGKWNKRRQLQEFNGYVHSIVSKFAIDFAKTEFKMLRNINNEWKDVDSHELVEKLQSPNPLQSGFQFLELHAVYMKLAGEAFWYVEKNGMGKISNIYHLRPDLVSVEIKDDKVGSIKGYQLKLDDGTKENFEPEEVVHSKTANPINPYRGLGIIEAAMTYIQTESFASEWTKNSIFNSGRPSGILNIQGKTMHSQASQLKKKFKQEYSGTKNAGKTLILEGYQGVDWVKLGMDLEGIDLSKIKKLTREDLMFMFRVSNTIMGISDDVNRANSKELRGVWMENEVKPEIDRLVDQIDHSITKPIYGEKFKLSYNDPNPETVEDRLNEWTQGHNKWLTTNTIIRERNEILGTTTPEIDGGDYIWQPLSLSPMEEPKEEVVGEPNNPDDTNNAPAQDTYTRQNANNININVNVPSKKVKKKKSKDLNRYERGEVMRKNLFDAQEKWEKPYMEKVNEVFKIQKSWVLEGKTKAVSDWSFDKLESTNLWKDKMYPITVELMMEQSKVMFEFVGDDGVEGELELTPEIRKRINDRIERFSEGVDDDTLSAIKEAVAESISQGDPVSKIRKKISDVYDTAMTKRAERIARTETIHASESAQLEAMRQLPSVVAMEWMVNPDACPFCQALNGKIVGLKETFVDLNGSVIAEDGSTFVADYENIQHPPLHVNCRCTTLPVNKTEYRSVLKKEYEKMDGRTKEAKEILERIKKI